jgi:2-keto-4-pentenoate hydratase/2-oxohepta-3-ene-1,7-dioic acid hydratase in catechol pathway
MKWLRYRHRGEEGFGLLVQTPPTTPTRPTTQTLQDELVQPCRGEMFGANEPVGAPLPVADIEWLTPCRPGQMLALWNNFRAAAQKFDWATPAEPLYFAKTPNSFAAHGQPVAQPAGYDGRVAYEGELAIVIGRETRAVSVADAPSHIFGYTCANDLTALELLQRDPSFPQWTRAKGFDGFGIFGPVIETEFDIAQAHVRTLVAGRERQNYPLSDMFFGPAELVSRLSQDRTLQAGDVILCGTSLGVLPMKPGSRVEVTIDGIGTLANVYG